MRERISDCNGDVAFILRDKCAGMYCSESFWLLNHWQNEINVVKKAISGEGRSVQILDLAKKESLSVAFDKK